MLIKNVDMDNGLVNRARGTVTNLEFMDNRSFSTAKYIRLTE